MIQYLLNDLPISDRHCVNIGLHYEEPVLFIKACDGTYVYITNSDWRIISLYMKVLETYAKEKTYPCVDYSENVIYAYNTILILNESVSFVNTSLNSDRIYLNSDEIIRLTRLSCFIEKHLHAFHSAHISASSYNVPTRSIRRRVKEMYARINKPML